MVVNVVLNVALVQVIGISGIILSTVFSLFVSIPWENYTIFKYVFHRGSFAYYMNMLRSAVTMLLAGIATFALCSFLGDGMAMFLIKGCICMVVPNVLFALMNHRRVEFKGTIEMAQRIRARQI